jgi:hypothetical protein
MPVALELKSSKGRAQARAFYTQLQNKCSQETRIFRNKTFGWFVKSLHISLKDLIRLCLETWPEDSSLKKLALIRLELELLNLEVKPNPSDAMLRKMRNLKRAIFRERNVLMHAKISTFLNVTRINVNRLLDVIRKHFPATRRSKFKFEIVCRATGHLEDIFERFGFTNYDENS